MTVQFQLLAVKQIRSSLSTFTLTQIEFSYSTLICPLMLQVVVALICRNHSLTAFRLSSTCNLYLTAKVICNKSLGQKIYLTICMLFSTRQHIAHVTQNFSKLTSHAYHLHQIQNSSV